MAFWVSKLLIIVLLFFAVKFDVTYRKIPNKLTIPFMLLGIIYSGVIGGLDGIQFSLAGLLVGLVVFIIPFALGGMGAGDVKLMAAVGSLLGWKLTVYSTLLTAIVGGIIVIGYTFYKGQFFNMLRNIEILVYKAILYIVYNVTRKDSVMVKYLSLNAEIINSEKTYIPYGVAIAIGTLIVLIGNHLGYPPFI